MWVKSCAWILLSLSFSFKNFLASYTVLLFYWHSHWANISNRRHTNRSDSWVFSFQNGEVLSRHHRQYTRISFRLRRSSISDVCKTSYSTTSKESTTSRAVLGTGENPFSSLLYWVVYHYYSAQGGLDFGHQDWMLGVSISLTGAEGESST